MNKDDIIIYFTVKEGLHNCSFLVYEDGNIFIHYYDYSIDVWNNIHLLKSEIYDDDTILCLKRGRGLFEDM